ncbi:MAG: rod shape-determining protein MreC [Oscillospiraceae bacterium]|nr:rod shape-determining protein MreC [Oscillospiraceae bacterium]
MKRFFKSSGFKMLAVALAFLLAGSVMAALTRDGSSPFASAAGLIFRPVQSLSAWAAKEMSGLGIRFKSSSFYKDRVDALEKELGEHRQRMTDYYRLQQENEFLREFLEIKGENPDHSYVNATIIGRDANDRFGSFTLNKGSAHGVKADNTVIYGKYFVGVVTSVMATQCTVETILHPGVNIAAFESRTRETGFVETTAQLSGKGLCRLSGIERSTDIAQGGIVCSSGTGGKFPGGLLIGEVKEIADAEENISTYAVIEPYADFSRLIDVFIITGFRH